MIKGGDIGFTKTPKKKPSVFKKAAKTIVKKGIKFAVSPLSLGLTAGTVAFKGIKKAGNAPGIKFSQYRQFDKRARKII